MKYYGTFLWIIYDSWRGGSIIDHHYLKKINLNKKKKACGTFQKIYVISYYGPNEHVPSSAYQFIYLFIYWSFDVTLAWFSCALLTKKWRYFFIKCIQLFFSFFYFSRNFINFIRRCEQIRWEKESKVRTRELHVTVLEYIMKPN